MNHRLRASGFRLQGARCRCTAALLVLWLVVAGVGLAAADEHPRSENGPKRIVLVAGPKSQALRGRAPHGDVVAWARQRPDGGRGFGTTVGHFYDNWQHPQLRTMMLNAIAWTAGLEVPPGGVQARYDTHEDIAAALEPAAQENEDARAGRLRHAEPAAFVAMQEPEREVREHYSEGVIGFDWAEPDARDGRWNETDVGPLLASVVELPEGPVAKGMTIRVGSQSDAVSVLYETGRPALRAAWEGGFLRFDPARFGLIRAPQIDGELNFAFSDPGERYEARFEGHYLHDDRVVLRYTLDGAEVLESPWVESADGVLSITRTLQVSPAGEADAARGALRLAAASHGHEAWQLNEARNIRWASAGSDDTLLAVALHASHDARLVADGERLLVELEPGDEPLRAKLFTWSGARDELERWLELVERSDGPEDVGRWTQPGERRWVEEVVTRGVVADDDAPLVVDTLTLPLENRYRALMFVSGHDFFSNGDMAISTVHGDVWTVSGVDERLEELRWRRFATGLFQPLGLRIIDDAVYVLGRDQITRLWDRSGNGEADYYENFNNDIVTSAGGHDYVACLETDSQGNFYFVHATEGVVRVSADGSRLDVIATGLRNPNGLGIGPDDTITTSPQEGEWTPMSSVIQVREGDHYGYPGPQVAPHRPLGYDPPLTWIPRRQDNSSGGQVWVTSDRWGPLEGQLLHLSYGQCRALLVVRERVDSDGGERPTWQGGTVTLSPVFDSGAMRGRFSPHDGQLYVSGLRGWVTSAVQDGCLQRVRYTGQPLYLPRAVRTLQNGLAITFTGPLDPDTAADPGSYYLRQWDYRYSQEYGSPELRPTDPRSEGRDEVEVLSATLLDESTVFLELPDVQPVGQLAVEYLLRARDGTRLRDTLYYTIHAVRDERQDESVLNRSERPGQLEADERARLRPGLTFRFRPGGAAGAEYSEYVDAVRSRLAALHVPADRSPSVRMPAGPFQMMAEGYLRVPLRGDYAFALQGRGAARVWINGELILASNALGDAGPESIGRGAASPLQLDSSMRVTLYKDYNRIQIEYENPADGDAQWRLYWQPEDLSWAESVPPTSLFSHDDRALLVESRRVREARRMVAELRCLSCHDSGRVPSGPEAMWELTADAPDLGGAAARLEPAWVYRWLLDPHGLREDAHMPRLFDVDDERDRQRAADVTAYLLPTAGDAAPDELPAGGRDDADASAGLALFEDLGCIACHHFERPGDDDDSLDRISLRYAGSKFRQGALEAFLRAPHEHYAWSRMPDFQLSAEEAASLAAHVRHAGRLATLVAPPAGDAEQGRLWFAEQRCASCHEGRADEQLATSTLEPLAEGRRQPAGDGCLADLAHRRGDAPRWPLDDEARQMIREFLLTDVAALEHDPPVERATRLVERLRCNACHARDGVSNALGWILVEEGARGLPPEALPDLTWTGEKLHADWMQRLFAGQLAEPPRNWLKARMPCWPAYADALAEGMAAEHGIGPNRPAAAEPDPQLVEIGRQLTLATAGLDCRQCHGVGDQQPLGDDRTQIALGINFSQVRERLRPEFYHRFMLDPARYDVATRMPQLSPDGVSTPAGDLLEGNARQQFEAIWHYLQSLPPTDAAGP